MKSKDRNYPAVLVFSVFRTDVPDSHNRDCHRVLVNNLERNSIPFKELKGAYKGVTEDSILVKADQLENVKSICKQFNQDSFLSLDENRNATLTYHNGTVEKLGQLVAVSEKEALSSDNYSFDPQYENYFIVK